MDFNEFAQKYFSKLREYRVPLGLAMVGLMFLGYGMIQYFVVHPSVSGDKEDILFEAASTSNPSTASNPAGASSEQGVAGAAEIKDSKQIVVDIEGAVEKPGVYKVAIDARVQDVLIAAGGMNEEADREIVAKKLNLAGKVIDGGKIYIPFLGDSTVQNSDTMLISGGLGEGGVNLSGLIDINSATASQLDTLPGVGPVTSQKIISNRPYGAIEELVAKKVVGGKVFEQIKDKVTVQ